MRLKVTRHVPRHEIVEQETDVRDSATVPVWIARGADCFGCKFPLTEHHHPNSHAVAVDLKTDGVVWFHTDCFQKAQV